VLFEPFHTGDAGAHITADINDFKVGAQQPQLRCTARRPGADAGAGGEGIKSQLITRNKRIARVFAFEGCRDHQPGAWGRGQVFQGVHRHIDAFPVIARQQALTQGRSEHAGAAQGCERAGERIPLSFDGDQLKFHTGGALMSVGGGGDVFGGEGALGEG